MAQTSVRQYVLRLLLEIRILTWYSVHLSRANADAAADGA